MKTKLDVWGSCVTRVSLLDGDTKKRGIADDSLELGYFIQRENIVSAMQPRIFTDEEIDSITVDQLWCHDEQILRAFKQSLRKETVSLLMNSGSEWLLVDLYDLQTEVAAMATTTFSNSARELFNTGLYRKYQSEIRLLHFLDIPPCLWYGYVDLFFEKIVQKYGKDRIILNRFRCNHLFLDKDGIIKPLPEHYVSRHYPNPEYNSRLKELEDYVIRKYDPWVIDLSKYYIGDGNKWDDLNGAHYENSFYYETFAQIKRIIRHDTDERYYSRMNFFSEERRAINELRAERFDVDKNIPLMEKLIEQNDISWINILDRLNIHAPEDPRVHRYMNALESVFE